MVAGGSKSPRKPSRSRVDDQGISWRLRCKIWALDLERIEEGLVRTEEGSKPTILMARELVEAHESGDITSMQINSILSDTESEVLQYSAATVSAFHLELLLLKRMA